MKLTLAKIPCRLERITRLKTQCDCEGPARRARAEGKWSKSPSTRGLSRHRSVSTACASVKDHGGSRMRGFEYCTAALRLASWSRLLVNNSRSGATKLCVVPEGPPGTVSKNGSSGDVESSARCVRTRRPLGLGKKSAAILHAYYQGL